MKIYSYCQRRNCSPLNVLLAIALAIYRLRLPQGVPPLGGVKQGSGEENGLFSSKMRDIEHDIRYGATENAGVDNVARSKMQGWKTRE